MKTILIAVIATLFVGSSGVAIYHHHCHVTGEESSYFMEVSHACAVGNVFSPQTSKTQDLCCESDFNSHKKISLECCSTDFQFVQLQIDLIQHHTDEVQVTNTGLAPYSFSSSLVMNGCKYHKKNWSAPPALKSQTRRALQQVYLI